MSSSRKRSKFHASTVASSSAHSETALDSHEMVTVSSTARVVLLVLGMHRTGTSVVSRALRCLGGAHSDRMLGANLGNEEGHFEDLEVCEFNEQKLLPALDVTWDSLAKLPWTRASASQLAQLAMAALQIVRKSFDRAPDLCAG
jgi:hypothetical protein